MIPVYSFFCCPKRHKSKKKINMSGIHWKLNYQPSNVLQTWCTSLRALMLLPETLQGVAIRSAKIRFFWLKFKAGCLCIIVADPHFSPRINLAPTVGYEEDAGSHTTHHFMYPESAKNLATNVSFVLVPFKTLDLVWITSALSTGQIQL